MESPVSLNLGELGQMDVDVDVDVDVDSQFLL